MSTSGQTLVGRSAGIFVDVPGKPGMRAVVHLPSNWRQLPQPEYRQCGGCKDIFPYTAEYWPVSAKSPFGLVQKCRKCHNAKAVSRNLKSQRRLRLEVLSAYGVNGEPACVCCGEDLLEFLCLDHIGGGGRQERLRTHAQTLHRRLRREGYPKGYRTLCHNCNVSYGLYGYCPHARK